MPRIRSFRNSRTGREATGDKVPQKDLTSVARRRRSKKSRHGQIRRPRRYKPGSK